MPKFKNKKTKQVIEENLIYYVKRLRDNPDFGELREKPEKNKAEENSTNNKEENNLPKE